MRRIVSILTLVVLSSFAYADWIEPYGSSCSNGLYGGIITANTQFKCVGGIVNVPVYWENLAAATSVSMVIHVVSTTTLVSGATTWSDLNYIGTQPTAARNISVGLSFIPASGDTYIATTTITGTAVISGTDNFGDTASATVYLNTIEAYVSSVAFCHVDSVVWNLTTRAAEAKSGTMKAGTVSFNLGTGVKIGLPNYPYATTDVYWINEAGTTLAGGTGVDVTYGTIDFTTDPSGTNEYRVWMKAYKN